MAQHDYNIVNGPGQTVRNDMNGVLAAILSSNSGTQPPEVKVPGTLWFDISDPLTPGTLRIWLSDGEWHSISAGAAYLPLTGGNIIGDLTVNGIFANPGFNGRRANFMGGTPPASPQAGMLWYDTTTNPDTLKIYSGGAWIPLVNTSSPTFTQQLNIEGAAAILNLTAAGENRRVYSDAVNNQLVFESATGAATMRIADTGDVWIAGVGWIGTALQGKQAALGFTPVQQVGADAITIGGSATPQLLVNGVSQGAIRLGESVPLLNATEVGAYARCTTISSTMVGNGVYSASGLRLGFDSSSTYPSGTWRNMGGRITDGQNTMFQRIA